MTQRTVPKPKTHVRPHSPLPDPDAGADHKGRRVYQCGLPIIDGDPRHTVPAVPDVQRKAAHDDADEG